MLCLLKAEFWLEGERPWAELFLSSWYWRPPCVDRLMPWQTGLRSSGQSRKCSRILPPASTLAAWCRGSCALTDILVSHCTAGMGPTEEAYIGQGTHPQGGVIDRAESEELGFVVRSPPADGRVRQPRPEPLYLTLNPCIVSIFPPWVTAESKKIALTWRAVPGLGGVVVA